MVLNCQDNGGAAAIIYQRQPGRLSGKLKELTAVHIPVALMSYDDGNDLVSFSNYQEVTLLATDGYLFVDGTSMSTPHAAGAAASLWRSCYDCSHYHVEACLHETALDLGEQGRDNVFGHGLVQMNDAFQCLRTQKGCC
jgi:serine protease